MDSIAQRGRERKGARRAQSALLRAKKRAKGGKTGRKGVTWSCFWRAAACAGRAWSGRNVRENNPHQFYILAKERNACRIATLPRVSGLARAAFEAVRNST